MTTTIQERLAEVVGQVEAAAFAEAAHLTKWLLLAGFTLEEIRAKGDRVAERAIEYLTATGHTCAEVDCRAAVHRKANAAPWPKRCSVHSALHKKAYHEAYEARERAKRAAKRKPRKCADCPTMVQTPKSGPIPQRCPSCKRAHSRKLERKRVGASSRDTTQKWVESQVLTK